MILKKKLSLFELNSFQPFAHGIWSNGEMKIGNEETLSGRNQLIVSEFKKIILKKYTIEEIKKLTILDIGGYDGLIATQIEEVLPFKKIVSLEPRKKNFLKGKFVRNYLNIESKVEFIHGNLNDIKEEFDIIFCVGVMHHLHNLNGFIEEISKLAKKSIFVENCSYNPKNKFFSYFLNKLNLKLIEPKDIIYKFQKKEVGFCGYKYETNYYDGSAIEPLSVVSLPNVTYLKQLFFVNGFDTKVLLDGNGYFKHIRGKFRDFSASIIYAEKIINNNTEQNIEKIFYDYEHSYLNTVLSLNIINFLEKYKFLQKFVIFFYNKKIFNREIILNLKYNYEDKINFEKAKFFLKDKKIYRCVRCLFKIIEKRNSDYRSCYRSYALLSYIYRDKDQGKIFQDFLANCNNKYPLKIIKDIENTYYK